MTIENKSEENNKWYFYFYIICYIATGLHSDKPQAV